VKKVLGLYLILISIFASLWLATQKLAAMLQYNPNFIGTPFMISNGTPYYYPWRYVQLWLRYHDKAPSLFQPTHIYFFIIIIGVFGALLLNMPKKVPDSHGSASWAEYTDMLKMDVISGSGVVIGLYDSCFIRYLTQFIRSVEQRKKEKVSFAEMAYDERNTRLGNLSAPVYDAKRDNPFSVWPWVLLYKHLAKLYTKLPHFYLKDNSNKHLAVIAPTRSGKGVGLIVPTLLGGWKESVIVNDIKSENWGITAGYRKKMGQVVVKFEPTAEDGSSARWNPLDEIQIGTATEVSMAQNLAAVIADYEGSGKPDHWTANAANVITAVILFLKYAHCADVKHYPTSPNLFTVASFLKANIVPKVDENGNPIYEYIQSDGTVIDAPKAGVTPPGKKQQKMDAQGFIDTLLTLQNFEHVPKGGIQIREWDKDTQKYIYRKFTPSDLQELYSGSPTLQYMPYCHPIIYQAFAEIATKPPNECGSIVSTANTALKEYLDPVLAKNTAVSDFCVDDLMNYKKPVSLYLVTPPSDLLRLAPIFRLFYEMMVRHHAKQIGVYENGQAKTVYRHKCLFLMDEFSSLGNLQSFAATLAYIAGYGMKVFLINQGLPQINGIYGKDNQILMNCHLQIFFAPNDNDTGKYTESLLGNKTIITESVSTHSNGFFNEKHYSHSPTARALMTSDEIKRLGEQEIIAASGFKPILTDKVKYYENDYFLSKLFSAPIVSDLIRNNPYPLRDKHISDNKHPEGTKFSFKYDDNLTT
jgi:type IV secretion system protein VirD4